MTISSLAFEHGEDIPVQYTCDGDNINPPLQFDNVPSEAESLVLICDDPDAPRETWTHWTIWDIPPNTMEIDEDCAPDGVEGITSWNHPGYGGPCPPSGTHRYFFKLYALNTRLNLNENTTKDELETAMEGNIIAEAELVGLYGRE